MPVSSPTSTAQNSPNAKRDFGALGNDIANDTTALQAAANLGRQVFLPPGSYRFTTLSFPNGGGFFGDGTAEVHGTPAASILQCTDTTTADAITVSSNGLSAGAPMFKDLAILTGDGQKAGGYALKFNPVAGDTLHFVQLQNVHIRYFFSHVDMSGMNSFRIDGLYSYFYKGIGVNVDNAGAPDVGDSSILACEFFNGSGGYTTLGKSINQRSSGGLKIANTKFNNGAYGYFLDLQQTTSDMEMVNCSLENQTTEAISFNNTTNTGGAPVRFLNVKLTANQLSNCAGFIYFHDITNGAATSYWDVLDLSDNIFIGNAAGAFITLGSARYYDIAGGVYHGNNAVTNAVVIRASCDTASGDIDAGSMDMVKLTGRCFVNNSTASHKVRIQPKILRGSSGATNSNAVGQGFISSGVNVVFGVTFDDAPFVVAGNLSGTGATGVQGSPSTTSVNFQSTGFSNSAVTWDWEAHGVYQSA